MKTVILIYVSTLFYLNSFGQESFNIYKAKLKSTDVCGINTYSNPAFLSNSILIDPGIPCKDSFELIGVRVTQNNLRSHEAFLNLDNLNHHLLDSIDLVYYQSDGIDYLDNKYGDDQNYQTFRTALLAVKNTIEMENLLKLFKNKIYLTGLRISKYKVLSHIFKDTTAVKNSINAGIKANIDSILISKNVSGGVALSTALHNYIDRVVGVHGEYYFVSYTDNYISNVLHFLRDVYGPNMPTIKNNLAGNPEQFNQALSDFWFGGQGTACVVGCTLVKLTINYNTSKLVGDSINAIITGKGGIPQNKISAISAGIKAGFSLSHNNSTNGTATETTLLCLKYQYQADIESLGNQGKN